MNGLEAAERILAFEAALVEERNKTSASQRLAGFRNQLLLFIKDTARGGNAERIVALEKTIIKNDLDRYSNSKPMADSLKAALNEFAVIERQLGMVDKPEQYKPVDAAYSLPKNRNKGLPIDEARQSFRSHSARLGNLDKSRLDDTEKQIIDARRAALSAAEREYIKRQARTLGVEFAGA